MGEGAAHALDLAAQTGTGSVQDIDHGDLRERVYANVAA